MSPRFFGKYRGKIESNTDPMSLGRVQVSVPAVLGDGRSAWAMPCVPYAGNQIGVFAVPPAGTNVWVEFEAGDPALAIWSGCFWGDGEVPASPADPTTKMIKLENGFSLKVQDTTSGGSVTLEVGSPSVSATLQVVFDASGIVLSNGSMKVSIGASSVSINDGALEVM